jgi:hypothetical protein
MSTTTKRSRRTSNGDDRETPTRALTDIAYILQHFRSSLLNTNNNTHDDNNNNKTNDVPTERKKDFLQLYDPYYCQGTIIKRLASVGFPSTINQDVDFYNTISEAKIPLHDVVLTNPPYSGDHIQRAFSFVTSKKQIMMKRPWAMLLPTNVYLRQWYPSSSSSSSPSNVLYLCPHQKYSFQIDTLKNNDEKKDEKNEEEEASHHTPYHTMWYIGGLSEEMKMKIVNGWDECELRHTCTLASTVDELPRRIRKVARYSNKTGSKSKKEKKMKKGKKKKRQKR